MHRNARRTAREIKRATPVYMMGADARFAANDSYCLRCGREGHSADECTQKLPAWPASSGSDGAPIDARERGSRAGGTA